MEQRSEYSASAAAAGASMEALSAAMRTSASGVGVAMDEFCRRVERANARIRAATALSEPRGRNTP